MTMDVAIEKKNGGLKSNYLVQAWLVIVLAVGFGISLAGVQLALGPVIEQNKLNETLERIPELVMDNAELAEMADKEQKLDIVPHQMEIKKAATTKYYSIYEAKLQGERKGWVVKTKGQGYSDTIELLLGVSKDLTAITGLFVLDQKETPGLGNKIITMEWRGQFLGKPTEKALEVVKTGATKPNQIDAVTGATISSNSVAGLINAAIADLRAPLSEMAGVKAKGEKKNG